MIQAPFKTSRDAGNGKKKAELISKADRETGRSGSPEKKHPNSRGKARGGKEQNREIFGGGQRRKDVRRGAETSHSEYYSEKNYCLFRREGMSAADFTESRTKRTLEKRKEQRRLPKNTLSKCTKAEEKVLACRGGLQKEVTFLEKFEREPPFGY